MSDHNCIAIYFLQKPFTANTEQMGCYYFNILEAVELCRSLNASIVPPQLPLCPRDNKKVELNSTDHWYSSILAIGSIDSTKVIDYTNIKTITVSEFHNQSNGTVKMNNESLTISGLNFLKDDNSKYWIVDLPKRWDIQGRDPHIFYSSLYQLLPLKTSILDSRIPEWYKNNCKKSFLGVHWRRGDRGNSILGQIGKHLWASTEPRLVGKYINNYISKNPDIEWVYVSTNSGSAIDRKILSETVIKPLYYFDTPFEIPALERWKWDISDLLMCAKAKHLLLSPGGLTNSSAFGRLIYAECLRQNPDDALVNFIPFV